MKWHAIFVETGREKEVKQFVELLFPPGQINTLIPQRKLIERKQGNTYEKTKKLFPGYVLAQTAMDAELYYKLKQLPAVYNVLRDDNAPLTIPEEEMEIILSLTRMGDVIDLSEIYKKGNHIKVLKGPLEGLEGIIEKCDHRKKRVTIFIDFLGQQKRVDLGAHMVSVTHV